MFDMVATEHNLTDEITVRQAVRRLGPTKPIRFVSRTGAASIRIVSPSSELENGECSILISSTLRPTRRLRAIAPASTMAHWRCEDRGPAYVKLGLKVAYRGGDLNDWIESQTIRPIRCLTKKRNPAEGQLRRGSS